jgi:hypothetical protein
MVTKTTNNMKHVWIRNGKLQLVLVPTDPVEISLFEELSQAPVDMTHHRTLQVGLEAVNDCVVITHIPVQKTTDKQIEQI